MLILGVLFIVFLFSGMPLAFTIGISSLAFFFVQSNLPLAIAVQRLISATQSFPLLAVPFFVMAGNLMNAAGITERLVKFSITLTGHMTGGLAQVSVILSTLMGGVSGSAVADAAMESRLLGPDMTKQGYPKGYSAAVIGLTSLITATIPPSVGLILYGFTGEVSIGRLFVAGIVPGIMMCTILMGTVYFTMKSKEKKGICVIPKMEKATGKEILKSFIESFWALLFPVIMIVTIRFGIFTPSEAGAFAVVYAFIVGTFIYRELSFKGAIEVLCQTINDNGMIMLIIACSGIFGYVIVYNQLPQTMAQFVTGITTQPHLLLFIILTFLFVSGMFMEATVNTLLLTPIFLPIVRSVGIDPVHFGILMMTIITMGGMTPPVGVTMYTTCQLIGCPTEDYVKESIPFVAVIVVQVAILALFPQLVLWLPNLLFPV
ncbi:TRAP transporter large permease [Clostridium formicaceticum]|jgi:tripartite ATP-independent transporter DctM subunit|uniref:C4-dicarboxylate ABC transporter n=1 Tax=Clostridium formicaceticum TaxID=1497 RepID=A0AAC9RNU2_9CLOT|nr:TRAP transporter large permease [Clostridium formicaceticum]AOY77971.1 C4-dicarboxylate ABC transporter [Clostridium formicaceticum]ARE88593.1 Sialic acid TRAP transporter permease protein SiaT [Clostridium formicaceticum]